MHIPDGYLSPSTCACLYGASAPFWYVCLKRIKATLSSQSVPLLSVFAAFSFVIMMFNLPLPGGTTGHAVGMGIATIVLGPAVSIIAISLALLIQALFFGDGGVTAYGANCFNMAIVGSLAAYCLYRLLSWKSALDSTRRAIAAGVAGYGAINMAAFLAAIEFGIQPLYFHEPSGAPLYAPYPLSIAIPAMMLGHLTIAGLAEFIISFGVVRYLQHSDPEMLRLTAPDAPASQLSSVGISRTPRALWAALLTLLLLTPLGILSVGSAWGEWSPEKVGSPLGMQRLYFLWTAPIAGYSPGFIRNAFLGYLLSAVAGVFLVLLSVYGLQWLFSRRRRRRSFVEQSLRHLIDALQKTLFAEETAQRLGLLQALDPRVKIASFLALVIAALATRRLLVLIGLVLLTLLLAMLSHISVLRTVTAVLFFSGLLAMPALFITPGAALYQLPLLHSTITLQGLRGAAFLLLRAEATSLLALLLVMSTLWSRLLRALRSLRVPCTAVVLVAMTYRYIFVFLQTAQSMLESRQTRLVGRLAPSEQRRLAAASAGVLLDKSIHLSAEVHTAMQARGFRGEVYILDDPQMQSKDWLHLLLGLLVAMAAMLLGR